MEIIQYILMNHNENKISEVVWYSYKDIRSNIYIIKAYIRKHKAEIMS